MAIFGNVLGEKLKAALRAAKKAAKAAEKEAKAAKLAAAAEKREAIRAASIKNAQFLLKKFEEGLRALLKPAVGDMETLWVATHQGIFHTDEVTAIALLRAAGYKVVVDRLPHQIETSQLEKYDLVVDIGRQYDGQKWFDHHHDRAVEASNMLVFKWLCESGRFTDRQQKMLEPLMRVISDNDRGIGESPSVDSIIEKIKYLNADDIYGEAQAEAFEQAVELMEDHVRRIMAAADKRDANLSRFRQSQILADGKILELKGGYIPFWNNLIFEIPEFDGVDLVIWYDSAEEKWKAQQVPNAPKSFERRGRKLPVVEPRPEGIEFIHPGEFFAKASSKEALLDYIAKYAV